VTTVREESTPDERCFFIQGRPKVQGLSWLIWGPVGALLVITILTGLAIFLDISTQSLTLKAFFIVGFLGLPALAWLVTSLTSHRLSERYLDLERDAGTREALIRLRPQQGELFYRTEAVAPEKRVLYQDIREVRAGPAIGEREGQKVCLILNLAGGRLILLDETLGTSAQKADLAHEIGTSLKDYTNQQKTPLV
jgi:hypothetical protein